MIYLGEEIKKLGFGLMRLPQKDGKIDVEQTKVMVDHFLEAGFTYFDTAWAYEGSKLRSGKLLWRDIQENGFSLQRKMQPGSIVKREKRRLLSLKLH